MSRKKKQRRKKGKKKAGVRLKLQLALFLVLLFSSFHLYMHPSLVFLPVSNYFYKASPQTWNNYRDEFIKYSNPKVEAEFLAALTQTESSGNPFALTYWKFGWSLNPLKWFRPASTATGLLQITSGTWRDMKAFCLDGKSLVDSGKTGTCPANMFRFRIFSSHSIHLVSAWFLKQSSSLKLRGKNLRRYLSTLHLCGKKKADRLYKNRFMWKKIGNCGAHRPKLYFSKVERHFKNFKRYRRKESKRVLAAK